MTAGPVDLSRSPHAALRPLELADARITGGFWADRQRLNRDVLLPRGAHHLEQAGNFENLRIAAGEATGSYRGRPFPFLDSDVYKWLEALGWELAREPSDALAALADDGSALVAAAQDDDGYLNSYYQVDRPGERFSNLSWDHELYCAGHLMQAAVAHARGRGDDRLLAVARRFGDLLGRTFGPGRREGVDGHAEVETALVELYRLCEEPRYLELAGYFIDARGHRRLGKAHFGSSYFQDHEPVRQATEVAGHAVRALYLAAGATDVYLETGDERLLAAMRSWWTDMAARKAYLTGGLGAHHMDEAFGDAYELPPDRCYGETCAAIASVMWNWRLLLVTGEPRYADLLERTLYNGFLAGLALDGGGYSYVNPLHVREGHRDPVERGATRRPWYSCACCPPNVMRLLASLQQYLATCTSDGLQIHQYAASELRAGGGGAVRVATDYPWDERIELEVTEARDRAWTLSLRVPDWCSEARLSVEGHETRSVPAGYTNVHRDWNIGDRVVLELAMPPRFTAPHPRIDAVRGCLAIERGPLVYCVEQADAPPDTRVDDLLVDAAAPLRAVARPDVLGGTVTVEAGGARATRSDWRAGWPYRPVADGGGEPPDELPARIVAVPYFSWGNRGPSTMRVWVPRTG